MKPTYENLIGSWYRPKARYPDIFTRQVYVQRVYYAYKPTRPWDRQPTDGVRVPIKYIEFQYQHEGRWITDKRGWYDFLTHFERMD